LFSGSAVALFFLTHLVQPFVLNLLLAKIRLSGIAIAVSSSGIAATLLQGGRTTAHSAFKLPLNLNYDDSPVCNICKTSGLAPLLNQCHLIVWDECTMAHWKT